MRLWNKVIFYPLFFVFLIHFHLQSLNACEDSHFRYSIESDSYGREILIWLDCSSNLKSLKYAIIGADGVMSTPATLSHPGQCCYYPQLKTSIYGDSVAIWYAIDQDKPTYSLYASTLHREGTWTTPVCLSNKEEGVIPNTAHLTLSDTNLINVIWESRTYFYPDENPEELKDKEELRMVTGTIKDGWYPAMTLANFR